MKRMAGQWVKVLLALVLLASMVSVNGPTAWAETGHNPAVFTDIGSHWAKTGIEWAAGQGIAAGYEDGSFRPNARISEREFLAMVFRAHPEFDIHPAVPGEPWYMPYYEAAERLHWPVGDMEAKKEFTRGSVARIIAATRGYLLDTRDAVQYLLDTGLSKGKTSATIEGYGMDDPLTRAEAVVFLYNVKMAEDAGGSGDSAAEADRRIGEFTLNGIFVGDGEKAVLAALGEPDRKDVSAAGYTWYVYNRDYARFAQIGIQDGKVVALFSNADVWEHPGGIKVNAASGSVAADAGVQARELQGVNRYSYEKNGLRITVYLDTHDGHVIEGILVRQAVENGLQNAEANQTALAQNFERQIWDLTNAFRVKRGFSPLGWSDEAALAARRHSLDMAESKYFDHVNPDGEEPWDRMSAAGVARYSAAAENIAAGYPNAFEAHNGWVNSLGHRKNMLNSSLTMLGVGVVFERNSDYGWYYTQNFFTPAGW